MQKIKSLFNPLFFIVIIFIICSFWILKNIKPTELINDITEENSANTEEQI